MDAYVFDVDGVITDLNEKKIVEEDLLPQLAKILARGDILAFNTGRSFSWVKERVLTPFLEIIKDKQSFSSNKALLKNVFIVCEMGNVIVTFKDGEWDKKVFDDPLPAALQEKIKEIINKDFLESMFFDETKETMLSIEIKDGYDIEAFIKHRDILKEKLSDIILGDKYLHLGLDLRTNSIAIDVQYEDAGKRLGAERLEDWIMGNKFEVKTIFIFGDNSSDLEMAGDLEINYPVTFVFVNDPELVKSSDVTFKIIFTKSKFTAGTLEYLSSQKP